MARSRNIKPGFFANEELIELSFSTRLLFIGLWTLADREGRLEDRPKRIKMALFPADNIDIDAALNGLQSHGFIHRYDIDSIKYIQIIAFSKHQNPHKDEKKSTIPAPCKHHASTMQAPNMHSANPADSLNTDSPIPDSPIPEKETTRQSLNGYGVVAVELIQLGVKVTSIHPTLQSWVDEGFTIERMREAVAVARQSKPEPETIPAGYLNTILRAPPKVAKDKGPPWWTTDKGIDDKGRELGLRPKGGETYPEYKARIMAKLQEVKNG